MNKEMKPLDFSSYISKEMLIQYMTDKSKDSEKVFYDAILSFLKALQINNKLEEVEFSDIHKTNFTYSWNKFISSYLPTEKHSDDYYEYIHEIKRFGEKLIYSFKFSNSLKDKDYDNKFSFNINDDASMNLLYDKFISYINSGNFESYMCSEPYCFNCGTTLHVKFNNWKGTLLEFKEVPKEDLKETEKSSFLGKYKHYPADNCFKDFIKVKTIEFKTPDLIITNWIVLDEFNEVVEKNGNIHAFDINCAKGRSEAFEHYFQQNFLSIFSSNNLSIISPRDKLQKDALIFGKPVDYDESRIVGFKDEGRLNGQLRATTIIEKDTLINIINTKVQDINKSKELVNNYLEENKKDFILKKIVPGKYNVVFSIKNSNDISFLSSPIDISEKFDPSIIMYPSHLELKEELKNEVKVKKNKI